MSLAFPKKNIYRGTYAQVKRFCKSKNIASRHIHKDEIGYYTKMIDRGKLHKRKRMK